MPYANLPSILALAKSRPNTVGFVLADPPQLGGRFASIDPDETRRFNEAIRLYFQDLSLRVAETLSEVPKPGTP